MTCDAIRNRLLAWPELSELPDDLRAHVAGCEACTAWAAKARQLDRLLAVLPAPDSAESKAAFVDYLTADGPIIKAVPLVDHPKRFSFGTWSRKLDWRVVSGLAAAALVGVGYWGFSGNGKPGTEVAGPKHELLARGVDFAAAMSTARTTQDRARLSVTMAGNLRDEVKDLYTVAPAEDLDKLADLYEKVVQRGLVHQSEELVRLTKVDEKHALWQQVRGHLADVARDAAVMQTTAPTKAKPPLERIRLAALDGQGKVDRLIANGGRAMSRTPLFVILFAGTAAWAGAQHGPNADKRLEMLAKNRTTVGLLIEYGLDLGDANEPVGRVNGSRLAAEAVRVALADAAGLQDVDRVVELGGHLTRLYRDGLVKTLDAATIEVPEGSPAMEQLKVARERAVGNATAAVALPFGTGKLGSSARVKDMSRELTAAAERVKAAAEPKK